MSFDVEHRKHTPSALHNQRKESEQMNSDKWYSGVTQVAWTCRALLDGRTISHKTEIREVRGWRLGAIVHRLRREYGWPIEVEYRGPDNVAHYFLKPGTDPASLRFPRSASALGAQEAAE
jgi:hypothetical protein